MPNHPRQSIDYCQLSVYRSFRSFPEVSATNRLSGPLNSCGFDFMTCHRHGAQAWSEMSVLIGGVRTTPCITISGAIRQNSSSDSRWSEPEELFHCICNSYSVFLSGFCIPRGRFQRCRCTGPWATIWAPGGPALQNGWITADIWRRCNGWRRLSSHPWVWVKGWERWRAD